jgi:Putative Actinobacterial Holin-X, holin superfamily III
VEPTFETFEPERSRSTSELIRQALVEAKLLARAEGEVAGMEVKVALLRGKAAGVALGTALVLALCGLALLFVTIALALPLPDWAGALVVGLVLLVFAGIAAAIGVKALPKKPMQRTKERLLEDLTLAREQLQ